MKYETRLIWVLGITFGCVFFDRNAVNFLMPFIAKYVKEPKPHSLGPAGRPAAVLYFDGSAYALAALVFLGWSAGGTIPLLMGTIPSETVPARHVATALGMVMGLGEVLGGVSAPAVAGWAADRYSLQVPMFMQAGCAVVAAALALFLTETAPARLARRTAASHAQFPA